MVDETGFSGVGILLSGLDYYAKVDSVIWISTCCTG